MKAAIVYFSGTGNTLRVGEVFKDYLEQNNYEVDMIDITKNNHQLVMYDLYIVGTPTYSKVSSKNLHDFIEKFINKNNNPNAHFITYVTQAWGEAYGHLTLKDFVKKKGFEVFGARAFFAPNNFYYMAMNKHSDEEVNVLYKKIQEDILDLLNSYFKGEKVIDSRSKIKKFFSNSLSKVMDKALMPIFAKKFFVVDNGKCNQCQVCVEQCPANNIEIIDTDITFKKQCLRCSKCIHICPQNAYIFNGKSIEQLDIKQSSILEQIQ